VELKSSAGDTAGSAGGNAAGGISGGAARSVPYAVPYAAAIPSGGGAAAQGTATGTITCAVPSGVEVFAGLGATMTVTAGQVTNVITVPLTAVEGSVKEGSVWLAPAGAAPGSAPLDGTPAGPAGEPQQRAVQLGLNDGSVIEIVSGLSEGESVREFIPGAPAQLQPGPQLAGPGSFPAGG
jgi:hypothetical protein